MLQFANRRTLYILTLLAPFVWGGLILFTRFIPPYTPLAYLAFFSSCIGPVFWTLVAEIFPNDLRGTAMVVPVLTQWIANAIVVLLFPLAFHQIGKALTFGFLAVMSLSQAVFTWFFVPETKNKPLEQIEEYWRESISAAPTK